MKSNFVIEYANTGKYYVYKDRKLIGKQYNFIGVIKQLLTEYEREETS